MNRLIMLKFYYFSIILLPNKVNLFGPFRKKTTHQDQINFQIFKLKKKLIETKRTKNFIIIYETREKKKKTNFVRYV